MFESADKQFTVTLMLADAAQVADGKLNALGIGWSVTGPGPSTFAVCGIVHVPWQRTNERHSFKLELIDLDGNVVALPRDGDDDRVPLVLGDSFEVGRPPGVRAGTAMPWPFVFAFAGVPLPAGGHFEFRLSVNGETREEWRLPFSTRSAVETPRSA
jgi:hypothetical protein